MLEDLRSEESGSAVPRLVVAVLRETTVFCQNVAWSAVSPVVDACGSADVAWQGLVEDQPGDDRPDDPVRHIGFHHGQDIMGPTPRTSEVEDPVATAGHACHLMW